MIYGIGVDIANIFRIKQAQEKNSNFAKRILTTNECVAWSQLGNKRKIEFLASRFSIKEAYSKALGTGIGSKVSFLDIEVLNDANGKPIMTKHPCLGKLNTHISISHTDELVMTEVILEKVREDEQLMVVGKHRNTKAIINLSAIAENINLEKKQLAKGQEIFAVVKANAYGHGLLPVAKVARKAGATGFCVAVIDEGVALRQEGFVNETILVLGVSPSSEAVYLAKNDLSTAVSTLEFLEEAQPQLLQAGLKLRVHLSLDTGMGRIGFKEIGTLRQAVNYMNKYSEQFDFEGIFTHFAQADTADKDYYQQQLTKFKELTGSLKSLPRYVHVANSAAALWHQECGGNVIRYGITMYGLNPSGDELEVPLPIKPALSLYSELVHVKKIEAGESVGYGSTYTAQKAEWIGTVPIGYADGWLRRMQGFELLVEGTYCEIVGRVCMDQLMIRLPTELAIGTKVTLIGKDGKNEITTQDVANYAKTINYEITCCLSERILREYKN